MIKRSILTLVLAVVAGHSWACDACQKQQPAFTRGITHGAGPESSFDWVPVVAVAALSLVSLFYSVKYIARPGEKEKSHIKHSILNS